MTENIATGLQNQLMDRIILLLLKNQPLDLPGVKAGLTILLSEYTITPKETALAVYTQGKNEILLQRFLLAKATAGCTRRTLAQYQLQISNALRNIGKDADQISSADIQILLAKILTAGNSKSYCDTVRRYLNTFYGWLAREELVPQNPMARVDNIKFHREKEAAFSDMKIERMGKRLRPRLRSGSAPNRGPERSTETGLRFRFRLVRRTGYRPYRCPHVLSPVVPFGLRRVCHYRRFAQKSRPVRRVAATHRANTGTGSLDPARRLHRTLARENPDRTAQATAVRAWQTEIVERKKFRPVC